MWRVQRGGTVLAPIRLVCAFQASRVSTKTSSRWSVSRETGVNRKAASRSAVRSGLPAEAMSRRGGGRLSPPPDMPDQQGQRRRGETVDPAGLADRPRADGGQLRAGLVGETLHHRVVDVVRQRETLVAAEGG